MERALAGLDRFNLTRTPNFEPRRGANVPSYLAAARTPILYLPVRGGPEREVCEWMAALDGTSAEEVGSGMSQKAVRQWKRQHPGHRTFTVVSHPARRAHRAFCRHILGAAGKRYEGIRQLLVRSHGLILPDDPGDPAHDLAKHRTAFKSFLSFLQANLNGQTAVRVDATWCNQAQVLQGFAEFAPPDMVIREDEIGSELDALARKFGHENPPKVPPAALDVTFDLADIYDAEIEDRIARAYQRDYMIFGFGPWRRP
jgi:hypothetical protein